MKTFLKLKDALFSNWHITFLTICSLITSFYIIYEISLWSIINATFINDFQICKDNFNIGACWGFVYEKWETIFYSQYPTHISFRPILSSLILILPLLYIVIKKKFDISTFFILLVSCILSYFIMAGGFFFLENVDTRYFGGIFLTLFIGVFSNILGLPLALLLAFSRNSNNIFVRYSSAIFVEIFRGLPLIATLFVFVIIFPLITQDSINLDMFFIICIAFVFLNAAYLSEILRSGINSIPSNQIHSAKSLNFSKYQIICNIILPQVFVKMFTPLVNQFVSIMKESTLVSVVGMFDLLGSLNLALGDSQWRIFYIEGIIFVAAIYWLFCKILLIYADRVSEKFYKEYRL